MGPHHQANHGRVFRGLDAVKHLKMEKRDSHGSHIVLNVPKPVQDDVETLTAVVYETVSADFDGPVAGYTTLTGDASTLTSTSAAATPTNSHESAYASAKAAASNGGSASTTVTAISTASVSPTLASSSSATDDGSNNKSVFLNPPSSAIVAATASSTYTAAAVAGTPLSATHGAPVVVGTPISATRAPIAQDGHAMSGGAKAGLAIGIILAIALAGGLLFFCWRRRRNPDSHQELAGEKRQSAASSFFGGRAMSEKHASASSDKMPASIPSAPTASTAPRLSLRPVTQFLPMLGSDNHKSSGNHLGVTSAAMSEKPKSMWERRSQNAQNPFEDTNSISEKQARTESPLTDPFDDPEAKEEREEPTTLKSTKIATAAAVSVAAAGNANAVSPMSRGPQNVHRVQLDFKPSMDDELELKSGQLVRMLHEYDDGWTLCIRMDRSQQGVAPRTCLSKLPVKPRPQGPPPMSPNSRPMSPGMAPRPLTPNGRERSGSNAGLDLPNTPTGVPARKAVPGQAL